jgi:hypothetical protein
VALALLLLHLQRRGTVATPIVRAVGAALPRHRDRLLARADELDARIRDLHLDRARHVAAAAALHLAGRCIGVLEVYAAARLLGMDAGAVDALVLAAVPLVVDLAFSMVPSQIGFHEGASALLARAMGFDPASGVAIAFLQRLRQVVFVSAGFALLALRRPRAVGDARTHAASR